MPNIISALDKLTSKLVSSADTVNKFSISGAGGYVRVKIRHAPGTTETSYYKYNETTDEFEPFKFESKFERNIHVHAMNEAGWTDSDIAEFVGCSPSNINRILNT